MRIARRVMARQAELQPAIHHRNSNKPKAPSSMLVGAFSRQSFLLMVRLSGSVESCSKQLRIPSKGTAIRQSMQNTDNTHLKSLHIQKVQWHYAR